MESRKMVLMNLFAGQEWRYRHRDLWTQWGRRGWDALRVTLTYIHSYV